MRRLTAGAVLALVLTAMSVQPSYARAHIQIRGVDNVAAAIDWSQFRFNDGTGATAVLGRSDQFPDALAAGALAGFVSAPFLVTATGDLDDRVKAELDRLGTGLVRIVGGTAAVSQSVEDELVALGYETERLAGVNRIATAVKVATDAENSAGDPIYADPERVYLARAFGTGTAGFADSLGGGMLAGTQGVPLLLTATASLSPETMAYLDGLATPPMVTIIGGTAAVSQAVQDHLVSMGFDTDRIADLNRYGTADDVAAESFSGGGGAVVVLVDGMHADSWVSGFAASAFTGSAVLLTNGSVLPDETRGALERIDQDTPGVTVLYCAPQVTEATCQAADDILNA